MRSTQNINICCGPAGPVPLTLRDHPLADVAPTHYYITEVSHPVALKGRNTIG